MEKEVEPAVLALINEKRLTGEKRTPVEIIARMGVFEARDKAGDHAWLATGDNVIAGSISSLSMRSIGSAVASGAHSKSSAPKTA